ncbi:MAG: cyclic nucleotide-binding domain-containing protein [Betaproteobacteria bacterium]|nr:MAG: cyclic nucleotide-binding domain-containing protein [Betaproteobacteria bacterium]
MNKMIEEQDAQAQNALLQTLQCIGDADTMVQQIFEMIGHSKFFSDFTREDVEQLAAFMQVYRADTGEEIIREGEVDDYLILIMDGRVEISKADSQGELRPMTIVGPGATLGEMSMIDGEPRFATCVALEPTTFAVLSRNSMVKIIIEEPALGSKILIKLVTLLSQRLRATSSNLLHYLEG